jgi:hypothetical protein
MKKRDWLRTGVVIIGLFVLGILAAESSRNCEHPNSSWVPCIWPEPLKNKFKFE